MKNRLDGLLSWFLDSLLKYCVVLDHESMLTAAYCNADVGLDYFWL